MVNLSEDLVVKKLIRRYQFIMAAFVIPIITSVFDYLKGEQVNVALIVISFFVVIMMYSKIKLVKKFL